jgi:uncharacterized membrane-anchored protein
MNKAFHSPFRLIIGFLTGLAVALTVIPSFATDAPPPVAWVEGGKMISMGDNLATLNLPTGYLFANAEDTGKLMKYLGNPASNMDIGLVVPNNESKDWFIVYQYNPMGYVSDSESTSIDKDALLTSVKAKTEEGNKQRQADGVDQIIDIAWQEEPRYDPVSHNLTWAISATEGGKPLVNYNTRKLGRGGVTSINLVATPATLPVLKPAMDSLVASYDYVPGKKYSDFVAGTDKTAEIGLAALIAGGAAAKTGFFAKIFLFLAVILKKAWIFIAIGIGAITKKLAGSKQSASTTTVESETDEDRSN